MLFAEVLVDVPTEDLRRTFEYCVAETHTARIRVGSRVKVPFGPGQRVGYVMDLYPKQTRPNVKPVSHILDAEPLLDGDRIALCRWLSQYYLAPLNEALALTLPPGKKVNLTKEVIMSQEPTAALAATKALGPDEKELLDFLADAGGRADWRRLQKIATAAALGRTISSLKQKGLVSVDYRAPRQRLTKEKTPTTTYREDYRIPAHPTAEQARALAAIFEALKPDLSDARKPDPRTFLLQGVTGSGKTEVYLRTIDAALQAGRTALVTVPEIALTPQMVARFKQRFREDVAILHSRLTVAERRSQWYGIRRGERRVVVGARSALFAPLRNLGVVVVDEEHEATYKQNRQPRYNARDVAAKRAEIEGAITILGTATPSLESRHRADNGVYSLQQLTKRVGKKQLPHIVAVDMRKETNESLRILSGPLRQHMIETLKRGEKVILFLNRRGFASFLLCQSCGLVLKCRHCAVSLVFHQPASLRCHHCHHTESAPDICPSCKSPNIRMFGVGTQRVEKEITESFPGFEVIRMDTDTTKGRNAHQELLSRFQKNKRAILMGTQMIAKGLDFPEVTLVGVINADVALNLPDFRAAERTFQLLMQVSGRAGRGEQPGKVVIQTYNPDHYAVTCAIRADYESFYREELAFRRELSYPPFTTLVNLLFSGEQEQTVRGAAQRAGETIAAADVPGLHDTLGPAPAPFSRLKRRYRWHLLLKVDDHDGVKAFLEAEASRLWPKEMRKRTNLTIDVDPAWIL